MWSRPRPGRLGERLRCIPVALGAIAALWLVLTCGLLFEPDRRTAAERPDLGTRWNEAAQRSLRLFDAPIAALGAKFGSTRETSKSVTAASLGIPALRISIAPQHEARLIEQAELAMDRGILLAAPDAFVPAWVELGERALRAKIRLKGDWADHLRSGRWSLRVRLRDGELFGMRSFSLHGAQTRGGHGEILLLDQMRSAGILAPRSFPVVVQLNQRDFGVQLVEEHFDTHLLESQARRAGLILAFDESQMWEQKLRNRLARARSLGIAPAPIAETDAVGSNATDAGEDGGQVSLGGAGTMPIRAFRSGRVLKDPALRQQFTLAVGLLRGYIRGDLEPEEVFDMTLWARHHCLVSLWGSRHGLATHNLRVYFNPITRRLEPIAFDNNAAARNLETPVAWEFARFVRGFDSAEFRAECSRFLDDLRSSFDLPALQAREQELHALRHKLGDRPVRVPVERLPQRCSRLALLSIPRESVPQPDAPDYAVPDPDQPPAALLTAYWVLADDGEPHLELIPAVRSDLVLDGIQWTNGRRTEALASAYGTELRQQPFPRRDRRLLDVPWSPEPTHHIQVSARMRSPDGRLGPPTQHVARIGALARRSPLLPRRAPGQSNHPGVDRHGRELVVRPGEWSFDHDLITPPNSVLRLAAGARLRFAQSARLVVRGSLIGEGTDTAPIDVGPQERAWGGIVVLGSDSAVTLRHVRIHGTASNHDPAWQLTGAVTLHRCRVELTDCRFEDTQYEDALNLVRSQFAVRNCVFERTRSDAFDGDATKGKVSNCRFLNVGGDALDFSHSDIELVGISAEQVTDKAVSIGERSRCRIQDLSATSVGVGVVAKDGSRVEVHGASIAHTEVAAFMAYVKKPEFGVATLEVERVDCSSTILARVQRGSTLIIDGQPTPTEALDVQAMYRTVMRKNR